MGLRWGTYLFVLWAAVSSQVWAKERDDSRHQRACHSFLWRGSEECDEKPTVLFGFRLGAGSGYGQIPSNTLNSNEVGSLLQFGPYLGSELVYGSKTWGVGFSVDVAPLMTTPGFLVGPPSHLIFAMMVNYFAGLNSRWVFGLNLFDFYQTTYSFGGAYTLKGFGLRAGYHLKLSPPGGTAWEGFAELSLDRYSQVVVDSPEGTATYTPADFMGPGVWSGMITLIVGVQCSFIY